jgi:two-component system, NtrC family, sensor kinase
MIPLAERLQRSVRLKLLVVVLAPLLIGVPVLLGLVWTWGDEAYGRMLRFKIGSDLVTAHQYFDRVKQGVGQDLQAIAASSRLARELRGRPEGVVLSNGLDRLATRSGLDFLRYLDLQGRVLASSAPGPGGAQRAAWPAVASSLAGTPRTTVEVFSPTELAGIDPALGRRAHQALLATPGAAPDARAAEDRGLVIHSAAPVFDPDGVLAGVLEGGVLLNGNLDLVDHINAIVYQDGALPLGSRGTAALFLGDTRIATNVRLFEGSHALGARVPEAVRAHVLEAGKVWLDTAFVVNGYYVSGYEPIEDGRGARVGMLYVGFLEAPFRQAKQLAMGTLFALFLGLSGLGTVLSLGWARSVFQPIEQMNQVIQRIEGGEAEARVGKVASRDELGRLAVAFDHLLDILAAKREELQRWADELDRKVMERTAELAEADETLRHAHQQLMMSEKLVAIGELTAGVAHEINNPVAVIQGNLDVLRDVLGPTAEPVRQEIRLIHQQADRIRQIVTKLLQFARPGEFAGYVEAVDVNGVLQDCLVLTRHNLEKRAIQVHLALDASRVVEINRGELQQVFINLLVNAFQAMPQGGTLTLASADQPAEDGAPGVLVRVADTGHGIAEEDLERIFDPFFTTKKGSGTGLGLSISYAIVQRYGGRIEVRSTPGAGAEFSVALRCQPNFDAGPQAPGFQARWARPAPAGE